MLEASAEAKKQLEEAQKAKEMFLANREQSMAPGAKTGDQKPAPQPESKPTKEAEATKPADTDQLQKQLAAAETKIAELTKRVRDEDGRAGGQVQKLQQALEVAQRQIAEVTATNKAIMEQIAKQNAPKPEEVMADRRKKIIAAMDPAKVKNLEEVGLLDSVVDSVLAGMPQVAPQPQAATPPEDIRRELSDVKASIEEQRFVRDVESISGCEGFGAVNYGSDPAWANFLGSVKPGEDDLKTWMSYFSATPTPERAAEVFKAFKSAKGNAKPAAPKDEGAPPKPSLESLATPAPGSATPEADKTEKVFTRKRLDELTEIVSAPRKMTEPNLDPKIHQEWRDHMAAARAGKLVA